MHESWFVSQPIPVKCALLHLCIDMGYYYFISFKSLIKALSNDDLGKAAYVIMNSKWALKNIERAKDISVVLLNDK